MISKQYRRMLEKMHADADMKWGNDGAHHLDAVLTLIRDHAAKTLLDFGCGRSKLSKALKNYGSPVVCTDYDPGRPKKAKLPEGQFDLVTCTDVLEHIEPEHLDEVLRTIKSKTLKAAYFVVDCVPANTLLPDGRNAHLTVQPGMWWQLQLEHVFSDGWIVFNDISPKKATFRCIRT